METEINALSTVPRYKEEVLDASLYFPLGKKKQHRLINAADESFVFKMKEDECEFPLNEPVFIIKIRVYGEGAKTKLKLKATRLSNSTAIMCDGKESEDFLEFELSLLTNSFSLIPHRGLLKLNETKITKVEAIGFRLNQAEEIANALQTYERIDQELLAKHQRLEAGIKQDRAKLETEKLEATERLKEAEETLQKKTEETEELESVIVELETKKAAAETALATTNSQVEATKATLVALKDTEAKKLAGNKAIEDAIERNTSKNKDLNHETVKLEKKLKELIENKNLFSEDLSSYNEESDKDIKYHNRWAMFFGAMLVVEVLTCFYFLADLALHGQGDSWQDILLKRLPFSVFAAFVFRALFKLTKEKLDKVDEIKEGREKLHAIGIIAKQVTEPIAEELDLSDEQKYDLKFKAKIDMIKGFLVSIVGRDYVYKEAQMSTLMKVVNRFLEGRQTPEVYLAQKAKEAIIDPFMDQPKQ